MNTDLDLATILRLLGVQVDDSDEAEAARRRRERDNDEWRGVMRRPLHDDERRPLGGEHE